MVSEYDLLSEMLGTYIDSNVVKGYPVPIRQPMRRAYIRVELEDAKMYIDNNALREFARTRQFGVERLETALKKSVQCVVSANECGS